MIVLVTLIGIFFQPHRRTLLDSCITLGLWELTITIMLSTNLLMPLKICSHVCLRQFDSTYWGLVNLRVEQPVPQLDLLSGPGMACMPSEARTNPPQETNDVDRVVNFRSRGRNAISKAAKYMFLVPTLPAGWFCCLSCLPFD